MTHETQMLDAHPLPEKPPLPTGVDPSPSQREHTEDEITLSRKRPRRKVARRLSGGLFPTLWPCDHGDTARRKFVVEGGLPESIDPSRVGTTSNPDLPYPQWFYTRGKDELFVYGVPTHQRGRPYFARVNALTLKVIQKVTLPRILYIGGALMHHSGDVFLVHGPQITRFEGGDLDKARTVALPSVNGMFTQYNGLTVAEDGTLILKGWAMTARELTFFRRPLRAVALLSLLCIMACVGLLAAGMPFGWAALPLVAPLLPVAALAGMGWRSGATCKEFLRPTHTGWILTMDPTSLEIRDQQRPPERIAYARLAVSPAEHRDGRVTAEWVVIPGDEHILRWRCEAGRLSLDPSWSERYRRWGDGSFAGTGPAIHDDRVYYTDNTAPIGLREGYRLFAKDLNEAAPQQRVDLAPGEPGFMFFSSVIDPAEGQVLVWDTAGSALEARDARDLRPRWRARLFNTDCVTVAADRGHVYAVDHSEALPSPQLLQSVGRRPSWGHIEKFFVVLDAANGRERLRLSLGDGSPVMAMIVPGMNSDVFVSTRRALVRIAQR